MSNIVMFKCPNCKAEFDIGNYHNLIKCTNCGYKTLRKVKK